MPPELVASIPTAGTLKVEPAFAPVFAALGLESAASFLDLPGEVVGGHPDRHVVRVALPGFSSAFFLKRQHIVGLKEKWRNWRAGFGCVSRCEREAVILAQLAAAGLPCPRWAAVGTDGSGRAFLLVEEVPGANDLRRALSDSSLSATDRRTLADNLGKWIAAIHGMGFTTPELSAKHVLIVPESKELTIIDWQSARQTEQVSFEERIRTMATLHSSLAPGLATSRERLRVLRKALSDCRARGKEKERFSDLVKRVLAESARIAEHRSIRDQRKSPASVTQRLVWLAGEAICAIPEVAGSWPRPAITEPFYGGEPGSFRHVLPDGREAILVRGRSFEPVSRFRGWVRGRPWRSPGATVGRLLFHLERYGIPAPRLLAFGQKLTGSASAEWFALHTLPAEPVGKALDLARASQLGWCLRKLHDAGCSVEGNATTLFGFHEGEVCVRDLSRIRIRRPRGERELQTILAALSPWVRKTAESAYRSSTRIVQQVVRGTTTIENRISPLNVAT